MTKEICTFVDNLAAAAAFPSFYHRKEKQVTPAICQFNRAFSTLEHSLTGSSVLSMSIRKRKVYWEEMNPQSAVGNFFSKQSHHDSRGRTP
jgi:hypothetical protein